MRFVAAIIGSPNVGKSCLFNSLIGKRKAIVQTTAGVTRDRLYSDISLDDIDIRLIDTGGLKAISREKLDELVYKQTECAIKEADIILFVCDVRLGATPADYHITTLLRKSGKKIFLVVNKVDNYKLMSAVSDFYQLGLGQPYPVSAEQSSGFEELLEALKENLKGRSKEDLAEKEVAEKKEEQLLVAVVGRPNVGKSSFINALIGQERVIVDEIPGTTRDSIDIHIHQEDRDFIIIDTAGIKHKRKIKEVVEVFSMARSKQSIKRADTVLVMLDAVQGLCVDDIKIIEFVLKMGKPCAVIVNKWDLVKDIEQKDYEKLLKERLRQIEWLPVIFTSCVTGKNIFNVVDLAWILKRKLNLNVSTPEINNLIHEIQNTRPHPLIKRRKIRILYATQVSISPPTFRLFSNFPDLVSKDYLNYIENNIRGRFGYFGVPIRFQIKEK